MNWFQRKVARRAKHMKQYMFWDTTGYCMRLARAAVKSEIRIKKRMQAKLGSDADKTWEKACGKVRI